MNDFATIKSRIQNCIDNANTITGATNADLTSAVDSLISKVASLTEELATYKAAVVNGTAYSDLGITEETPAEEVQSKLLSAFPETSTTAELGEATLGDMELGTE